MSDPKLRAIVGLGNPGAEYARTRHNAGFWLADRLAAAARVAFRMESKFHGELARARIEGADVLLLKPTTYMNRSGQAVQALAQFYKIDPPDILVAHDELDLAPGVARLKAGGGHGGHNGLRDLHHHLGEAYLRLRIGVGHPGEKHLVMPYLTETRISKADEPLVLEALARAEVAIHTWLAQGWDKGVQQLHSSEPVSGNAGPKS